ncbi:unnamed protein product [Eruca vesicaria subsp. sativa]|uniref:Uncharacterized protein n=1 Tax=Eruca vesicaria subsp. sativa TaxID=29727 RepID=A0ABC8LYX2_ERUVS|nr:unnamed protein product [Eruca vesicaria subsp. sativa]
MREAGFTEQRLLPAFSSGRITARRLSEPPWPPGEKVKSMAQGASEAVKNKLGMINDNDNKNKNPFDRKNLNNNN